MTLPLLSLWTLLMLAQGSVAHAADGDLDPSFGGTGIVSDPVDGYSFAYALATQADGKIVLAGSTAPPQPSPGGLSMALVRFETGGTLDPSFGSGGRVSGTVPDAAARDLVVLPDGRIVAVAVRDGDVLLVRFESDGDVDTTFGTAGVVSVDCGTPLVGPATLARLADGRLVAAGPRGDDTTCVVRTSSEGVPDASFGGGSVILTDVYAVALAAESTGTVVLAGNQISTLAPALARVRTDGTLDGGFGSGGIAAVPLPAGTTGTLTAVAVLPNGSLVAGLDAAGDAELGVVRFLAKGTVDAGFGAAGLVLTAAPAGGADLHVVSGVAVQRDGKVLLGGYGRDVGPPVHGDAFLLARYDVDGTLDATFAGDGIQTLGVAGTAEALRLQADGKALLAGSLDALSTASFVAARYDALTVPCPAAAAAGCKAPVASFASQLKIDGGKTRLQWKWAKGAATTLAELGDPVGTDAYTLCLYDESAGSTLRDGATVPAGGTCAGKACWRALGSTGFAYADKSRSRFGVSQLKLKAGADGKAQIQVRGDGPTLPLPPLPAALPLRVQLLSSTGACWEAVFSAAGTSRNDGARLQAKAD